MIICAKPWPVIGMENNIRILNKLGYKQIRYDPNVAIYKVVREGTPLEIFKKDLKVLNHNLFKNNSLLSDDGRVLETIIKYN